MTPLCPPQLSLGGIRRIAHSMSTALRRKGRSSSQMTVWTPEEAMTLVQVREHYGAVRTLIAVDSATVTPVQLGFGFTRVDI